MILTHYYHNLRRKLQRRNQEHKTTWREILKSVMAVNLVVITITKGMILKISPQVVKLIPLERINPKTTQIKVNLDTHLRVIRTNSSIRKWPLNLKRWMWLKNLNRLSRTNRKRERALLCLKRWVNFTLQPLLRQLEAESRRKTTESILKQRLKQWSSRKFRHLHQ